MRHLLAIAILLFASSAHAADPQDAVPESLREYWVTLADLIQAVGNDKIDAALRHASVDTNPAFRTPEDRAKFREGVQKMLAQMGKLRAKFESYDIVAVAQVSSQAFTIIGVGNGHNGPTHIDFDVFFYDGRWHLLGMHYHFGFKRDREIPARATFFDKPVSLRLDRAEVALIEKK
mgnify:CR=1 FL=1